jgi:hydrogenase nickel incorporation protein HypA/HybF
MHETAITEALFDQVRGHMPERGRLIRVRVELGALEHIQPEVMATVWEVMTRDTPLAGSNLEFRHVALRVRCDACGHEYEPEDAAILLCPECGVVRPTVRSGRGVRLLALEVEEE